MKIFALALGVVFCFIKITKIGNRLMPVLLVLLVFVLLYYFFGP